MYFSLLPKINIYLNVNPYDSNEGDPLELATYNLLKKNEKKVFFEKVINDFINLEKELLDLDDYTLVQENQYFLFYNKEGFLWYWIYIVDYGYEEIIQTNNSVPIYTFFYITSNHTAVPIDLINNEYYIFLECDIYTDITLSYEDYTKYKKTFIPSTTLKTKLYFSFNNINTYITNKKYIFNSSKRTYVINFCRQVFLVDKKKNFKLINDSIKILKDSENNIYSSNEINLACEYSLKEKNDFLQPLLAFKSILKHFILVAKCNGKVLLLPIHSIKESIGKDKLYSYNLLKNEDSIFMDNALINNKKFILHGNVWLHNKENVYFPLNLKLCPFQLNEKALIDQLQLLNKPYMFNEKALKNIIPDNFKNILKNNIEHINPKNVFFDLPAGLVEAGTSEWVTLTDSAFTKATTQVSDFSVQYSNILEYTLFSEDETFNEDV